MAGFEQLKENAILRGSVFPEPVRITKTSQLGKSVKIQGTGLDSGRSYTSLLDAQQIEALELSSVASRT